MRDQARVDPHLTKKYFNLFRYRLRTHKGRLAHTVLNPMPYKKVQIFLKGGEEIVL